MKDGSRLITGKVVQYGYHRREIPKGELGEFLKSTQNCSMLTNKATMFLRFANSLT